MKSTSHQMQQLAVVLFAYNEEGNLLRLLRRLQSEIIRIHPKLELQYAICVQGNVETLKEAEQFQLEVKERASVNITHSSMPLGIRGAAVRAFEQVKGKPDAFLMMDCDLNHQPEELDRFFSSARPSSVIIGSRYTKGGRIIGMPLWKRILSELVNRALSLGLMLPALDKTSGYRLIWGKNVQELARRVQARGFDFYIEFLILKWRSGLSLIEVPISFKVRTVGKSKMKVLSTLANYCRLILRLTKVRTTKLTGVLQSD